MSLPLSVALVLLALVFDRVFERDAYCIQSMMPLFLILAGEGLTNLKSMDIHTHANTHTRTRRIKWQKIKKYTNSRKNCDYALAGRLE